MVTRIERKIVDCEVEGEASAANPVEVDADPAIEQMGESISRPHTLRGSTYKIKTPLSEHALYITINDIVLNEGTAHEHHRPYEMFINSKNMDHFQWVLALTRVVSAVFRKGGDIGFLVEELKAVFDPKGGYFKGGGKFMPSLVAEIGECLEEHLVGTGVLQTEQMSEHQRRHVEQKRSEFEALHARKSDDKDSPFPGSAQLCSKCLTKAVILMDGCMTCLSCGDSKCN